jgi:hypothetical protein
VLSPHTLHILRFSYVFRLIALPTCSHGLLTKQSMRTKQINRSLLKLLRISICPEVAPLLALAAETYELWPIPAEALHGALQTLVVYRVDFLGRRNPQMRLVKLLGGNPRLLAHAVGRGVDGAGDVREQIIPRVVLPPRLLCIRHGGP